MCYHFAILQLFRPFVKLRIVGSKVSPSDVCHQAADAIQGLLKSFSQLYTLRRAPSLTTSLILASAISHLDIRVIASHCAMNESDIKDTNHHTYEEIFQDISNLTEMSTSHHSAQQSLGLLGHLARSLGIDIGVDGEGASDEDYDRLVRPYMSRVNMTARRVRIQDFATSYTKTAGVLSYLTRYVRGQMWKERTTLYLWQWSQLIC